MGRPRYSVYPQATSQAASLSLKQSYNAFGFATQTEHATTGFVYSSITSRNDDGQVKAASLGGGLLTHTNSYSNDGLGRIATIAITGGTSLTQNFTFESVGNLNSRKLTGGGRNEVESFGYDALDRLIQTSGTGIAANEIGNFGYDSAGNLTSKAGLLMGHATGTNSLCSIGANTHCAVRETNLAIAAASAVVYDGNGNIQRYTRPTAAQSSNTPGADGALLQLNGYTALNLPTSITKTIAGTVQASSEFFYDAGYQRVRQVKRSGAVQTGAFADDILYVVPGGFELHRNAAGQVTQSIAAVSGPDGVVATVTTNFDALTGAPVVDAAQTANTTNLSGTTTITKLLLKDHLGSMVAEFIITTASGNTATAGTLVVHGLGPWGNARNAASPLADGQRGFTGHEHLAELGIIHMNGRLYDPVLGRFLQADPIIQAPHNAQSHNRYSYVLNNPLSFTDPSGFSAWTKWRSSVIAAATYVAVAWATGGCVECAQFAAGAVRSGMNAHANGTTNVLQAIVSNAVGAYLGGPILGSGIEVALNGGNRRQIGGAIVSGIIGDIVGQQFGAVPGIAAGGCAGSLVNRGSCWAGARDSMIAAGIQAAGTQAYAYVTSWGVQNAVKGSGASQPSNNGEALQRFEREMNNVWAAMKTLPEIKAIDDKYGPLVIKVISSGDTGVQGGTKTLQINPSILTDIEYKIKEPETWNNLGFAEWNKRSASMPEYFSFSPMRLLAHEVLHLSHPNGIQWVIGADRYEAEAVRFENMIINKYFDPNEPARQDHRSWRPKQ